MKLNAPMGELLKLFNGSVVEGELPEDLREVVDAGWQRSPDGLLSPGCAPRNWSVGESGLGPQDLMVEEIDLNDFRIDDDDLVEYPETYLKNVTSRAFLFAVSCLERARDFREASDLRAVVIVGLSDDFIMHGATVRFFVCRQGIPERYWDLERYEIEGIALVSLDDIYALRSGKIVDDKQ